MSDLDLDQTCPSCGALAGQPCMRPSGKPQPTPHQQRTPEGRDVRDRRRRADMERYYAQRRTA